MKLKLSTHRRKSADISAQLSRLYDRLVYWLYERQDGQRARAVADRLQQLLASNDTRVGSILAEECRALIHETKGDLKNAIKHRKNEIRLIRRLQAAAQKTADEDFVLQQYSHADLKDRLDLLAMLYHDIGDLDHAAATLQEAKELCENHGIKFNGVALLRECQASSAGKPRRQRTSRQGR
jgi:tetratricopeptide (TPR) repeat protein